MKTFSVLPFAEYCTKVQQHIERDYGIRVVTRDVPDPLTGDLDGLEIHIDFAVTREQRLFLLAHLFGHTVQWNVNPQAYDLGRPRQPPVPESIMPALMDYEKDAARYALSLLHEIGISGADQWLSDYTACDLSYLAHFYRTGEKKDFASFWRENTERIQPLVVPRFTPVKRALRSDGIVI
jgi:hypothetical protein